jgi:hypothetical protein
MRAVAIACGLALGAAATVSTGAIAKPSRDGKIVRVERPRTFARQTLRICEMETTQVGLGTCLGGVPEIDDEAEVYDLTGFQGRIRITQIRAMQGDLCAGDSGAEVLFEYIEGQGVVSYGQTRFMVFGADTRRETSKTVDIYNSGVQSPSANNGDQPYMVLDVDGDGAADLMNSYRECAGSAPPNPYQQAVMGTYNQAWCIDYWRRGSSEWEHLRKDYFYSCR